MRRATPCDRAPYPRCIHGGAEGGGPRGISPGAPRARRRVSQCRALLHAASRSVALSFTPRRGLASALIFRYDPRHGIAVQREVKQAPWKGRPATATGDRLGNIGITAVSAAWVETKTLTFIEAVLKAN